MKVLLIRPVTEKSRVLNVVPPIGLGYLASVLKGRGHRVGIIDSVKESLDQEALVGRILETGPEVIGFQTFSHDVTSVRNTIEKVKALKPGIIAAVGGAHPSGVREKIFKDIDGADYAFSGEAEIGFPAFLEALEKGADGGLLDKVPGLIWREHGKVSCNKEQLVQDLDSLPFPAWDLINPAEYPEAPQGVFYKRFPIAPLIVTRGCPYSCTFCAGKTISGRKLRFRSVDNVLREIRMLKEDYGIGEFHILDDNFTLNNEYAKTFCREVLSSRLDIAWNCPNGVRLDTLDRELLGLMKESGCYTVSVGIESGSERILKLMKKGTTLDVIRDKIKLISDSGLTVNGFFIIGYPGETREEIKATIKFAKSLPLTRAIFYNYLPLPGTPVYEQLLEAGLLKDLDWGKTFQTEIPYSPEGIGKDELKGLQREAHLKFYLRPGTMYRLLREIKTLGQLRYIMRRAGEYLK